ncbi:MAG: helix-turn-helix transcriptional regulator [Magnetospirillum sp.]|nr:helix-turn-helix transcriptional regulator [Magnetospirillum sp.]
MLIHHRIIVGGEVARKANRGKTPSGAPNPIDVHVGGRVRLRRTLLGLTQEQLGEALGLTFQQVQKYERGLNRISASRLHDLAGVLDVPISFFFDDMSAEVEARSPRLISDITVELPPAAKNQMLKRETLELVRAYYRIADPQVRRRVYDLARALADASGDHDEAH